MSSAASRDHYRRIKTPLVRSITEFLNGALKDARHLPGKAAVKAEIEERFGDVPGIDPDKLAAVFTDYARRAQPGGTSRFQLRGEALQLASAVVARIEKADRLIEVGDDEEVDVKAIADATDDPGTLLNRKFAAEREQKQARELIRKAGL